MTMEEVYNLKWEPLKAYYDNCIKAQTRLEEISSEKVEIRKKIRRQEKNLAMITYSTGALVDGSLFGMIIVAAIMVLWFLLNSFLFHLSSDSYAVVLAIAIIVGIVVGGFYGYNRYYDTKMRDAVDQEREERGKILSQLKDEEKTLLEEEKDIRESEEYHDMLLMFDDHLDVKYMTALRKLISNGRVLTHPEAVRTYVEDQRLEKQRELLERNVIAREELAANTESLSSSISSLSRQVESLNKKCASGTVTGEDGEAVLSAASDCSTLVANVLNILSML